MRGRNLRKKNKSIKAASLLNKYQLRCITANLLQTKVNAQCGKLATEVDSACDGRRFRVIANYLSKVASCWATVCKTVRPMLSDRRPVCLSVTPVGNVGILWPNGWMDRGETWYKGRPRHRPRCVRWGPSSPPKGAQQPSPQFSAHVCCDQTAGWIKMPLSTDVDLGPRHVVLDGDPAPPPEKGTAAPSFRPMSIVAKQSPILATAESL